MKTLRCFVVMSLLFVVGATSFAQTDLNALMRERGEYYFTLSIDNPEQIQAISEICSVDGTDGRTVVAYANQQEYDKLLQAGYQPELQTPPSLRANVEMWNGQGTYNWNCYLTYDQYVSMMENFPSQAISGRTCTLFSLGTLSTSSHRQLLGVRINNGSPEGKPKFLYSSTMHGDEITGMILMLRLINELCTSTDSQIVDLVNNLDIYILPLTNPDGTYKGGNNTVNNAQRYNGHNIDLNRNYKDYYQGAHPDGNSYEDETIWTMAMGDENLFTMSANYHGGAEVMNYPWDATYDDHADKAWYEYVCTEYVQIARQTHSSYMSDTYSDGVTSGAAWYVITGSRQDYMNAYAQCREVTVECSTTKTPSGNSLPSYWNYNRNSMLAFMEQCLKGVHGFVYDAETGLPIEGVTVTVQDHDSETSFVTTHSAGDFHRPIKGGSYTFAFEKEGYCPQYVDVTVADGQRVELNNIQLTPGNCIVPNFSASATDVSLGQSINFTDASSGTIASWSWTFEGATPSTSTAQNPTGITYNTPGDYDVTLIIIDAEGDSATLTKENYIHVAESINMHDGSVTTCSGIFYDSGGANSNYGNDLTYTMTFYPATEGAMMSVTFSQFNTESGYDYLYIYDGTSISATQIGQYSGTTGPGTVTATNAAGALTFKFTSDSGVNNSGWVASVSCVIPEWTITATANVVEGGTVEGAGVYTAGEICTLIASAAENYQFIHWTENDMVVSTDTIYSFQVTGNRDLVAVFGSTIPVNITVSANPSRAGSVSGGGEFLSGETCTVTATPNDGYSFTGWTEDETVVSEDLEYSFMVTSGRDLVANFVFEASEPKDCYSSVNSIAAGDYVMGSLNNTTLSMLTRGNSGPNPGVAVSTMTVVPTDYGFSVEEGTSLPQITLTTFGNNGQYYIIYHTTSYTYYLAKSNTGTSLTWSTSQNNNSARWYINDNGIYVAGSSFGGGPTTNYYLYYDTNSDSFKLSTTSQNNITFYTEGECPAAPTYTITATAEPAEAGTVEGADLYFQGETCTLTATASEGYTFVNWTEDGEEVSNDATYSFEVTADRELVAHFSDATTVQQTITLPQGWSWWSTYLDIDLAQLEEAMGSNGLSIVSQSGSLSYYFNVWDGNINSFDVSKMYMLETNASFDLVLTGTPINPAEHPITLVPGFSWIAYPVSEPMSVNEALSGLTPVFGDFIKSSTGISVYTGASWSGSLLNLEPGKGYMYYSNATETKTFYFPATK